MAPILHLRRELLNPPVERVPAGIEIRTFVVPDDVEGWLQLRHRATAGLTPPVREWTRDDFEAQLLCKPWWRDDWTWLSIDPSRAGSAVIGAVKLAMRSSAAADVPIVHWLLVDPACRRRGIGRMLTSQLECAAWKAGWRQIELETHSGWKEAAAFYQSMGYAPVPGRSPR